MGNFYMESTQINYRRDEKLKTVDQKLQELSETSAIDTDIAPVFSKTATYNPGDMVYYKNKLYVFNVEHTGAWAAADVTATDVTTEISSLKSGLTNVQSDVKLNTNDLTTPSRTKNLLLIDLPMIKAFNAQGTWDGNSYTRADVTYTLNFDGNGNLANVTVNGTASADGSLKLVLQKDLPLKAGSQYIVSGSTGGSANTYAIDCEGFASSQDGESEPFTYNTSHPNYYILIAVKSGVTLNNKVFYPMVRLASVSDPTYTPYIPSVGSRIEAVESVLPGIKSVSETVTLGAVLAGSLIQITIDGISKVPKAIYIKDSSKGFPIIAANFWVSNNVLIIQAYNVSLSDRTESDIECVLIYC